MKRLNKTAPCKTVGTGVLLTTLAGGLIAGCGAPAQAKGLAGMQDSASSRVIVTTKDGLTAGQQGALLHLGTDIYRHLPVIHALALSVPTRNLPQLAALPFVEHVSPDVAVAKSDEFTVESTGADIALTQYSLTGQGVTVAVLDSGVLDAHKDLCDEKGHSRIVGSVKMVSGGDSNDKCGHGTHVAGIIAGNGKNSSGTHFTHTFYGIARKANLVDVAVLDNKGQGSVSGVLAGIQWVIQNQARYNIRVLNLSLGHPVSESYTTDPLCQAVEQAWKAGIVVVCAAGNSGRLQDAPSASPDNEGYGTAYGSIQSPGNDPSVITVGAMKSVESNGNGNGHAYGHYSSERARIATYSSRGPSRLDLVMKPDLVAPGNRIISTLADNSYLDTAYSGTNQIAKSLYCNRPGKTVSNKYFRLSGTSMASPVVAGAAALLLEKDPMLTPDTIKARLMASADKCGFPDGSADVCTFGAGYLDIPAALASSLTATGSALSPVVLKNADGSVSVDMSKVIWGTSGIWGTGVSDLKVIWGCRVIWGVNTVSSSKVIWGCNVWADRVIWGTDSSAVDLTSTAIGGED